MLKCCPDFVNLLLLNYNYSVMLKNYKGNNKDNNNNIKIFKL